MDYVYSVFVAPNTFCDLATAVKRLRAAGVTASAALVDIAFGTKQGIAPIQSSYTIMFDESSQWPEWKNGRSITQQIDWRES